MNLLVNANALHIPLANESVHMVVTSPPYWGLRSYTGLATWEGGDEMCDHMKRTDFTSSTLHKTRTQASAVFYRNTCGKCGAVCNDAQLGHEILHDCLGWAIGDNCGMCYICVLRQWSAEIYRVLRKDGTFWLNIGDSYTGSGGPGSQYDSKASSSYKGAFTKFANPNKKVSKIKAKNLCGIPERAKLALQADGWIYRSNIVWHKPNAMPESVTDRPTQSHEALILFAKSSRYFYDHDAVRESYTGQQRHREMNMRPSPNGRHQRDVWSINTVSYKGAHFATYPPNLIIPCIKVGTSEHGCCPQCKTGWIRVLRILSAPDRNKQEKRLNRINVMPGRDHVKRMNSTDMESVTHGDLGWSPGCSCYGVALIGPFPSKRPKESNDVHSMRCEQWETQWKELKPQYALLPTAPAIVLDPFVGSGTTLLVARDLGRSAIGLDLNFSYLYDQAMKRLSQVQKPKRTRPIRDFNRYSQLGLFNKET